MSSKEFMIGTLHKLYREDDWIKEQYGAIGAELDGDVTDAVTADYSNLFFSSLTPAGATNFEKDLNIITGATASIEDRRKVIQSKWLAKKFSSLPVIQAIADSFYNGDVTATYAGDAEIVYKVKHHLAPIESKAFLAATDEIKPAHIGESWEYIYNKWKDYYFPLFWQDEQAREWVDLQPEDWKDQYANTKTWSYCNTRTWEEHLVKDID